MQCTTPMPQGSGQWTFCNELPYCLRAVGRGTPAMHCITAWGAAGSETPAMQGPASWGQWAVDILQYTAHSLLGSGQMNSCNALPHCLRAVGSGTPALHYLTAFGQWAV